MSSTSRHELLDAAKQRLSKANKQVTADTNNVASAKLMMDNAIAMFANEKSQLHMSKKEAEEAKVELQSTEDKPAAVKQDGSSNKRVPIFTDLSSTAAA